MKKILLHTCCAVCAAHSINKLISLEFMPIVYYYNPNIYTNEEYEKREEELRRYLKKINIELILGDYETSFWYNQIKGLENAPEKGERCDKCFEVRLRKTAEKSKELNIETFTTSLSISPHKISKNIINTGNKIANEFKLNFLDIDFKKEDGFKLTNEIAKKENFYRQNYCGCEFSIRR